MQFLKKMCQNRKKVSEIQEKVKKRIDFHAIFFDIVNDAYKKIEVIKTRKKDKTTTFFQMLTHK